jgi:hypothetical protein
MPSASLIHDHATALATAILEMVSPCLRPEETREAWSMFLEASKAMLEKYEEAAARQAKRLCKPSRN